MRKAGAATIFDRGSRDPKAVFCELDSFGQEGLKEWDGPRSGGLAAGDEETLVCAPTPTRAQRMIGPWPKACRSSPKARGASQHNP